MPNFVQTPTYLPNTAPTYPDVVSWGASSPFSQKNWLNASQGPGFYGDNPWYNVDTLKNPNVQLDLARAYVISSFWNQFAPSVMAINGAERLEWSEIFAMEPNQDPLGLRQIWLQSNYTDTRKMSIGFNKYGDKVAIHDYDRMIQAKRLDGTSDLWAIAKNLLGESITTFLDYHVRNAYLESVNNRYMGAGWQTGATHPGRGGLGFGALDPAVPATSYFDPQVMLDIQLALRQRSRGITGSMVAATTPGVIHSLVNALNSSTVAASTGPVSAWREKELYAGGTALMNYELGMVWNTRFVADNVNILYNCGTIYQRGTTTLADYRPGDGAWDGKVDGQWEVGQQNSNTYHWFELGGAVAQAPGGAYDPAKINVGDIVTIHQRKMPASGAASTYKGVPNGVDYRDGTITNRRVVAVTTSIPDINHPAANQPGIAFDVPLMKDYPIGTFITKGVDIHPVVFMTAPSVVMAVGEPISAFERPSIDDLDEIRRYAWKGYFQAHMVAPQYTEVVFCAAPKSVAFAEVRP